MLLISYVLMFFLGLIVAYRVTVDRPSSQKIKWMMSSAMILWSISVIFNESVNRLIDMILSSLLLLAMYHKTFAGIKVLAKFPFVNTLGKISYEFFVYHLCVIASFSCWIFLQLYSVCGYYSVCFGAFWQKEKSHIELNGSHYLIKTTYLAFFFFFFF